MITCKSVTLPDCLQIGIDSFPLHWNVTKIQLILELKINRLHVQTFLKILSEHFIIFNCHTD